MKSRSSAGILVHRVIDRQIQVLLVHPGGPFWAKKDAGAWTIPKGEFDAAAEDAEAAARREFVEETGQPAPDTLVSLGSVKQSGGKVVHAFAGEGDCDVTNIRSNSFEMEWPPRSRRMQTFPEIDRAAWFTLDDARERILAGQRPLLDALLQHLREAR
ncbi:MAG TPA: NUDIX domain-containing protein [Casimicrobiaceae bacterium]|nr:NUDIX domain-containing protein [Casimicrobiaceae bacterium]